MTTTKLSLRQFQWVLELSRYDFKIRHQPGKNNPTDFPSRGSDFSKNLDGNLILPTFQQKLRHGLAAVGIASVGNRDAIQNQTFIVN